jgi:hypothetical protein
MELFHYCSNTAFISIIENREIWASDLSLSNDREEGHWVKTIIRDCLSSDGNATLADLNRINDVIDIGIMHSGAAGFCMSEKPDLLSQWRLYADDGSGVSIGFTKEYFDKLGQIRRDRGNEFNIDLTKVVYEIEEQKAKLSEIVDFFRQIVKDGGTSMPVQGLLEDDSQFAKRMSAWRRMIPVSILSYFAAYSMKNPSFFDEREWRFVSHNLFSKIDASLRPFDYRAKFDRIVPYRRIRLEDIGISPISSIYLGPKNMTSQRTIEEILKLNKFNDVPVYRSISSYR